ncbi:MAG: hypothetical protein HC803_00905 [Saprospiraceae bacterium]|nr:hypothetical protein [Saprospiraceae bacterium]
MKIVDKLSNSQLYIEARDIVRIANEAVVKAKAENKRFGIPEFFSKNGKIYFILESGEVTTKKPNIYKK